MTVELKEYFDTKTGLGVLSTADSGGRVNSALFSRPHFLEEGMVSFITRERLTYSNLQTNPAAAYLFKEDGDGYEGVRLHLTKVSENDDQPFINSIRRVKYPGDEDVRRILINFRVDLKMPLVGG